MRYILLFSSFLFLNVYAQESELTFKKFNIGVNMGLNVSRVQAQSNDTVFSKDFNARATGHFGIKLMYNPNPYLSIRTGGMLNIRGYKAEEDVYFSSSPTTYETVYSFVYMDVPLILQLNLMPDVENGGIFVRGGGYYAFAVGGGTVTKTPENGPRLQTSAQNFSIGNDKSDFLRKQDYGVTIGGGLGFKSFELALVWDVGLANISNDTANGFYAQNRLFRIDLVVFAL